MKRAFTMLELLVAILILGVVSSLTVMTFNAVTHAWTASAEYMDKMQRCDYAINQVVSALRAMYYPHEGQTDDRYGFVLQNNGDGRDADASDVIEWAKTGPALVGGGNASADSVHRVQLRVIDAGDRDWPEEIAVSGLYARLCPDPALRPKKDRNADDKDYSFANADLYAPVLVADGIVGMNCRVLKQPPSGNSETDRTDFDDEWSNSNSVPYKVELTFMIADPDGKSYRTNTAPLMRIVRIPIFEQSQDGAELPSAESKTGKGKSGGKRK